MPKNTLVTHKTLDKCDEWDFSHSPKAGWTLEFLAGYVAGLREADAICDDLEEGAGKAQVAIRARAQELDPQEPLSDDYADRAEWKARR